MKCLIYAILLFCTLLPTSYSRHVQFYRKDYTYVQEFDAFYKVHYNVSGLAWKDAFLACKNEGATLFFPEARKEWTVVKKITEKMIENINVKEIFVGLHDEFKVGEFLTVDGHSTPYPLPANESIHPRSDYYISMNIDTGKFKLTKCLSSSKSSLPFVCKKVDDEVSCPTIDHGYRYLPKSRKCYKINYTQRTWQDAMKTCYVEGGILAVIENNDQAQEIGTILKQRDILCFVGVKTLFPGAAYYTVKGQKFSDVYQNAYTSYPIPYELQDLNNPNDDCNIPDQYGFLPDINGQYPDGSRCQSNDSEPANTDCGTVRYVNNKLYTSTWDCDKRLPFICEMEIGVLSI